MKWLIAAAIVVVIGGVALALMLSSSDPDKTPAAKPMGSNKGGTPIATSSDPSEARPAPSLPDSKGSAGSDHVREYMVGDTKVRDHRTGSNNDRTDIPPNPHPANTRDLPSELTADISSQVNKQIRDCAAALPKEARGDKPKVLGQIVVGIKDHKLSITKLILATRDITDDAASDALKQCTQEKSAGLVANAKNQDDISDYGIQINFAIL